MQRLVNAVMAQSTAQTVLTSESAAQLRIDDFDYELPESLIAQYPAKRRSDSRLLVVGAEKEKLSDSAFTDLPSLLCPNDLLVFNDTRVIPARLHGRKESGGKVEMLLERILDEQTALVQIKASKSPKPDTAIHLDNDGILIVESRRDQFFVIRSNRSMQTIFEQHGLVPLPPYISRIANRQDQSRYQTVYAKQPGAVAAPTAGLHFDEQFFDAIAKARIETAFLTLHVGSGTFQPVRTENVSEHRMHGEVVSVEQELVDRIKQTRREGGRVIAVGTTTVRALESAAANSGDILPLHGETDLFITPGYKFKIIDVVITNFHLPRSTLLMMVCAFGGYNRVMRAYKHAVNNHYRFYSYGDAMWIERGNG